MWETCLTLRKYTHCQEDSSADFPDTAQDGFDHFALVNFTISQEHNSDLWQMKWASEIELIILIIS